MMLFGKSDRYLIANLADRKRNVNDLLLFLVHYSKVLAS